MSDDTGLLAQLEGLGEQPLPGERSDAALIAAAMEGVAADAGTGSRRRTRSPVAVVVGVVLAVAAAVLLGWWLLPMTGLVGGEPERSDSMAPSTADDAKSGGRAVARHGGGVAVDVAPKVEPAVADEPEPEAPEPDEPPLDATGSAGTEPEPPLAPVARTAAALLDKAQRQASKGRRAAAITTYERLVARHPGSDEAKAARVSLGRLELARGRARSALGHFDAYLASSAGPLVEEARYGRIRALRALGRHEQERRSIEAFLGDHPKSLYVARLRSRAEQLSAP